MPIGEATPEMVAEYRAAGYWPTVSSMDLFDRIAELHADKEALVDARSRMTFGQFAQATKRLALAFHERGIKKGDIVVAQVPNCVEYMLLWYGFRRIGAISLFTTMDQRTHEIRHALDRLEAVAVFLPSDASRFDYPKMYREEILPVAPWVKQAYVVGEETVRGMTSIAELLADPIETRYPSGYLDALRPDLEDYNGMTSTSGTTALPKFILMKETGVHNEVVVERARLTADDVALVCAPLRGGGSNGYKYAVPLTGLKGVFQDRFDAEEALQLVQQERATVICAVPAQFIKMLDCPNFDRYDLSSLRVAYYAGALMPPDVAEQVRRKMRMEIVADYGAMDAGIFTIATLDDPPEVRHRTVGRLIPGVSVRVLDTEGRELPPGAPGELLFGGPNVGRGGGYFRDPELTAKAYTPEGWYMTGDMGVLNPDGTISIVGRKKDMIIRGGQNISPKEVEDLVLKHPKVLDVAVVGMPDRVMGEKACAFVVPKSGQTITFAELIAFLRQQETAAYKLPERLELMSDFPMSADGQKVQKTLLRDLVTRKLQEEGTV